jgi:hypothetical protein
MATRSQGFRCGEKSLGVIVVLFVPSFGEAGVHCGSQSGTAIGKAQAAGGGDGIQYAMKTEEGPAVGKAMMSMDSHRGCPVYGPK